MKITHILILLILLLVSNLSAQSPEIVVYLDSVKNKIPLYGYNHIYSSKGGNLINDDSTWNKKRKDAVITIQPAWIRFPGGTIGHLYNWENGIGPKNIRFGIHGFRFWQEDNFYGLDEAARLAEAADSELVIHVSLNQSADNAANLVEYMNSPVGLNSNGGKDYALERAQNGHYEPYNVRYWEIGNEGGNDKIWQRWNENLDPIDYSDGKGQYSLKNTTARDWIINGGKKSFHYYKAVKLNSWLNNDIKLKGLKNEVRYTKLSPIAKNSLNVYVGKDSASSTEWKAVKNFSKSTSNDLHFTYDYNSGKITFGDGINGKIPVSGHYVFTDFTIKKYDGFSDIYREMKKIDSNIKIASSYAWIANNPKVKSDGFQLHLGIKGIPDLYPDDLYKSYLSSILGEYSYKYNTTKYSKYPLFVTEIETPSVDLPGTMFFLMLYSKMATWGKLIKLVGANYMLGTSDDKTKHISSTDKGSVIQGPGYVTQLFNKHFGDYLIKSTTKGMSSQTIKYYKNLEDKTIYKENLDKVYSISSINEDSSKLFVLCINTTNNESIDATIKLLNTKFKNIKYKKTVKLKAESINAINTKDNPNAISLTEVKNEKNNFNGTIKNYDFPPASATVFIFDINK